MDSSLQTFMNSLTIFIAFKHASFSIGDSFIKRRSESQPHQVCRKGDWNRILWQHNPMIVAATHLPIHIDLGKDDPGMTLQRRYREGGNLIWRDVVEDGQVVLSPVDIDALPFGKFRLRS